MLRIGDIIFSLDLLEKKFRCNLQECLGNCCRYGDAGAPLTDGEVDILGSILPEIKPYLRPEGYAVIEKSGTSVRDFENEWVTPLIGNAECAYTYLEGNIFKCVIEKAHGEGKIDFNKPMSCHLFPARIKKYSGFLAVNYQELSICHAAVDYGDKCNVFVYEFLKVPLIRAFGEETYDELCLAAEELRKNTNYLR